MSANLTEVIGFNIKKLRESHNMSQQELAKKMNLARPGISNWENGKSEPSSSQLVQLSRIFKVSTDEIVGNATEIRKAVVVDTSALIKRPLIIDELNKTFDEVIIPEVVIAELDNLKDRGKGSVKQQAWLVMKSIKLNMNRFTISQNTRADGKNDEKIADIAIRRAKSNPMDNVYLLSNDIVFSFLTMRQKNLESITPLEYIQKFQLIDKEYDSLKTSNFYSLIKSKNVGNVKKLRLENIDVNYHNPDDGFTPLIRAVRNNDYKMVDYLISLSEIDLDAKDKSKYMFTAVHHATQKNNLEMVKKLAEAGADIDIGSEGKNSGNTPLMVSAWSGFTELVDFYISQNACLNQQDGNGFTPLIKACIKHNSLIVKKLIPGTDISIRSRENKKAQDYLNPNNKKSLEIIKLFQGNKHDR